MATSSATNISSSSAAQNNSPTLPLPTIISSSTPTNIQQTFSIKLNSKNFIPWKLQFQPLLNFYHLHDILYGTEPVPPKTITNNTTKEPELNPAYTTWFNKDQILFSWLLSSISEEVYPHLIGLNSASEVWHALSTAYGMVNNAQRTQLYIELHNLNKNDMTVSDFLFKAKNIADSLTLAGQPISKAEFNAIIFRNLG